MPSLFEHEAESHGEHGSFINELFEVFDGWIPLALVFGGPYDVIKFRCAPSTHSVDGRKPSMTERNIGHGVLKIFYP